MADTTVLPPPAQAAVGRPAGVPRFTFDTAFWGLLALGVGLRVVAFLQPWSLWYDEACLALNLAQRAPAELLRPLAFDQGAPPGFLLAEKAVASAFGASERTLRLLPGL